MEAERFKNYYDIALRVARKAGKFLIKNFGPIKKATHKSNYHFGIEDDLKLNNFYEETLTKLTPEVALYTEEGEKNLDNDLVWVVDPIDGTSNYRVGNPFYVTQICLLSKNEPVVSVVYAPSLDQIFTAVKGQGTYLNNKKVKVSPVEKLSTSLISIGKGTKYDDRLWYGGVLKNIMEHVRTFRHFGSAGLELAYTACGKIDIYMNKGSQLYDYAPGSLLIEESGGKFTNFTGKSWNIYDDSILASNPKLHNQILAVLNESGQ